MQRARERAVQLGVHNVVVATNTGRSVHAAKKVFGERYRFFAVGNPNSSHERGLCLHRGIDVQKRRELEAAGIEVDLIAQTLFQGSPSCKEAREQHAAIKRSYARRFHKRDQLSPGSADLIASMGRVLGEFVSDGPRVCLEVALAAADSGRLPLDCDCISIATPSSYCDLPDAAIVLRPAPSQDLFSQQLRIKDLLFCPTPEDVWFNNQELP